MTTEFEVLALRSQAKELFDRKWISVYDLGKLVSRTRPSKENIRKNAYEWLAERINVKKSRMQFRFLSKEECVKVITLCQEIAFADCERWAK